MYPATYSFLLNYKYYITQLGPYFVDRDALSLSPNPFSWNRRFGLLFIDNPLGTGFSAAPSPAAIPTNQSHSSPLSHVVVYGAGHLMPADNGRAAQEMIEDWVLRAGLFGRRGGMKRAA
uniref:Serine carboxypeptidase-like n=1 Tax=Oryza meridionalis TaxID=40149 RepID=A0A0E0DUX0_9ORYZ